MAAEFYDTLEARDPALREATAHCQSGVPGTDDDGRDLANGGDSRKFVTAQMTVTVTFVGLVTMS